jgi:hypothetical protein
LDLAPRASATGLTFSAAPPALANRGTDGTYLLGHPIHAPLSDPPLASDFVESEQCAVSAKSTAPEAEGHDCVVMIDVECDFRQREEARAKGFVHRLPNLILCGISSTDQILRVVPFHLCGLKIAVHENEWEISDQRLRQAVHDRLLLFSAFFLKIAHATGQVFTGGVESVDGIGQVNSSWKILRIPREDGLINRDLVRAQSVGTYERVWRLVCAFGFVLGRQGCTEHEGDKHKSKKHSHEALDTVRTSPHEMRDSLTCPLEKQLHHKIRQIRSLSEIDFLERRINNLQMMEYP